MNKAECLSTVTDVLLTKGLVYFKKHAGDFFSDEAKRTRLFRTFFEENQDELITAFKSGITFKELASVIFSIVIAAGVFKGSKIALAGTLKTMIEYEIARFVFKKLKKFLKKNGFWFKTRKNKN